MLYKDSDQQKQQNPYALNTPYGSQPVAQPGQGVPVTDKVPGVPTPLWVQHASLPQPGMILSQPSPQPPRRSLMRTVTICALTFLLVLVFGVGTFSGWTFARSTASTQSAKTQAPASSPVVSNSNFGSLEAAQETAIAKAEPAVVQVQGIINQGESLGSGIIVDNKGDIVTNNHVVSGTSSLTVVLNNGSSEAAQIVGTDPAHDLAVIRIQPFAGMSVAILGDSTQLAVGQEVLAIGNPLGYTGSATAGVVSALNRSASESSNVTLTGLIQTSAAINPGNSGGALINLQGQVVGIPTLSAVDSETKTPANGIGFAIPSNQVQTVVARILGN